jgi:hypothetical protein
MGLMNSVSSYFNPGPKKEIKETFMKKIKREPNVKTFNNKISPNITKYLFDYFSYKELYEMGKINLYFMNNIIDYIKETEPWPEKIRKFKSKYNLKIYKDEVDLTLKEAKINKRRYKFPSDNGNEINYYQFDMDGNKYISIARSFNWAHKNNNSYWREIKIKGSYEPKQDVPYLITVCWVDTNFSFFHVKKNNYKLYMNETFITSKKFVERIVLKVIIDENIIIYEKKFPNQKIFDNNNNEEEKSKLNEDFICYIKKEDFDKAKKDEKGDYIVKIEFSHGNDNYWKEGWIIDGGCLREITQKEMNNEIEIMKKKIEEEERKKLYRRLNNDE